MLHWHKETLNINIIGHFVRTKRPVCLLSWTATSCRESNRPLFVVNVDTVWDYYTLRKHPVTGWINKLRKLWVSTLLKGTIWGSFQVQAFISIIVTCFQVHKTNYFSYSVQRGSTFIHPTLWWNAWLQTINSWLWHYNVTRVLRARLKAQFLNLCCKSHFLQHGPLMLVIFS